MLQSLQFKLVNARFERRWSPCVAHVWLNLAWLKSAMYPFLPLPFKYHLKGSENHQNIVNKWGTKIGYGIESPFFPTTFTFFIRLYCKQKYATVNRSREKKRKTKNVEQCAQCASTAHSWEFSNKGLNKASLLTPIRNTESSCCLNASAFPDKEQSDKYRAAY